MGSFGHNNTPGWYSLLLLWACIVYVHLRGGDSWLAQFEKQDFVCSRGPMPCAAPLSQLEASSGVGGWFVPDHRIIVNGQEF